MGMFIYKFTREVEDFENDMKALVQNVKNYIFSFFLAPRRLCTNAYLC